jgi:hypothetical protein
MSRFGRRFRATIASGLIALTGCYSYAPIAGGHPARGTQVRARLSTPEDLALTEVTVASVVSFDAEVVRSGEDSLVVSAVALRSQSGVEFAGSGETLAIPASSVASLEERRFSLLRSSVLIVAAGTAASLLFAALGSIAAGGGGGKPDPNPQ